VQLCGTYIFDELKKVTMREILEEIRSLLKAGKYRNEEQVRFSLVARILQELDWNIWNPEQVYTEFKPNPTNDNKKVDVALFLDGDSPSIFIEIKSPEKLNNPTELLKAENQLKDYNADLTALFTLLTDGNQWRFYYSQEGGTFSQKRFKTIKLIDDNMDDIESAFEMFLQKEVVQSGEAKKKAYSYLQLSRRQKIMEECLPQARRKTESNPLLNLVEALIEVTTDNKLDISEEEALEFIQNHQEKKTSVNIETREQKSKIKTHQSSPNIKTPETIQDRTNYGSNPPDLKFTRIESGIIGNQRANKWNKLLSICLQQLFNNGWTKERILSVTRVNIEEVHSTQSGFHVIEETQFSHQYVNSPDAARALIDLARSSGLKLEVDFFWKDKPGAAFPNKKGRIVMN